jgi:transposase
VSHANAALTPCARLRLARLVVDQGWSISRAAERYDVSWSTAKRWADRYRRLGPAWIHHYNHHRPRTAIGGSAPITRLTILTDQYN